MKPGAVWRDDIASLAVANHQTVFALGQIKGHEQTKTSIQAVLLTLARRSISGCLVDPPNDVHDSAVTEYG